MAGPEPLSCDEEGIIPSSISVTIRGKFDNTLSATVRFGFLTGKKFDSDPNIEVQLPTQVEYDRIRVPVQIYSTTDLSTTDLRYVRVIQKGTPGVSKNAIFRLKKGDY